MMRSALLEAAAATLLTTKSGAQTIWASALALPVIAAGDISYLPIVGFAALCGGLARAVAERQRVWPHGISTVFLGLVTGVFLWPVGRPMAETATGALEMGPFESFMFGGFVCGLLGVTLIGFVIDLLTNLKQRAGGRDDS